ncbi:MAG: hypothetical protein JO160_01460 [Candidatus Eremiobacteraeota bacterium]|nr:hypothetical protein [Candidatus Eremiobacteraeota bacterium]
MALGYQYLGICFGRRNDARKAREHYLKAHELFKAAGDRRGLLRATVGLAYVAGELEPDPAEARRLSEAALLQARDLGDAEYIAVTAGNFAEVCRADGDWAAALRFGAESAKLYAAGERWARAAAQYSAMAHTHAVRGEYQGAFECMASAWELLQRQPVAVHVAWYFEVWFMIAATLEQWETAATLYGFIGHYRDANDAGRLQGVLTRISTHVERVFSELGRSRVEELLHAGERLTVEEAQSLSLSATRA